MKFLTSIRMSLPLLSLGLLVPVHASATTPPASVPEPFSLALLATGIAGLGAAEVIRRRRGK